MDSPRNTARDLGPSSECPAADGLKSQIVAPATLPQRVATPPVEAHVPVKIRSPAPMLCRLFYILPDVCYYIALSLKLAPRNAPEGFANATRQPLKARSMLSSRPERRPRTPPSMLRSGLLANLVLGPFLSCQEGKKVERPEAARGPKHCLKGWVAPADQLSNTTPVYNKGGLACRIPISMM